MHTIQPYSFKNNVYFGKRNKKQQKFESPLNPQKTIEKEKNLSFVAGALCMATILLGVNEHKKSENEFLLEQLKMQIEYSKPEDTNLKVIDATNDNIPDIIIEDRFGTQSIYDIKNKSLYYKDEHEFEKIF